MLPPYLFIIASQPREAMDFGHCSNGCVVQIFFLAPHFYSTLSSDFPFGACFFVPFFLSSFHCILTKMILDFNFWTVTHVVGHVIYGNLVAASFAFHFYFFQQLFRESIAAKTDPLLSALVAVVFFLFFQCFRAVTTNWVATWIRGLCINHWIRTATNTRKYSQSIFELKRKLRFPWLTKARKQILGGNRSNRRCRKLFGKPTWFYRMTRRQRSHEIARRLRKSLHVLRFTRTNVFFR